MKVNTLAKLAWCLDHEQHEVILDEDVRSRRAQFSPHARPLRRHLHRPLAG
jgi:quinolinate synthase